MTGALSFSFERSATKREQGRESATRTFSIRLSAAERRQLEGEAGSQALGTYIRARLLDNAARRRRSAPAQDRAILSEILGGLGRLRLASSLADLAAAAKIGAVAITPDLEREVSSACRDLRDIRAMLMRALGLKPEARV